MKNVLVTGADGFIGSHLVEQLIAQGIHVRALVLYNSFNSWGWLEGLPERLENEGKGALLEIISGDIRDPDICADIVEGRDLIFHLASLIAIPYSYQAPASYLDTNVRGTLNILRAARNGNGTRFIHISTSEVYGSALYTPIDEKHPLQPQSPYSASKISSESFAMSYYYSYELPVTVIRPFNTYGPRQSARAVIPSILVQLLSGRTEVHLGALEPTRDFNYVLDTCNGLIGCANCDASIGEIVNIGSGGEISIGDLLVELNSLAGTSATVVSDTSRLRPHKSEVNRLCCDYSKAKKLFNYEPTTNLHTGLKQTLTWLSSPDNLAHYKATLFNR